MRSTLTPFILSLVFLIAPIATAQPPMGTVFTYQGELTSGGAPVDEPVDGCDFEFTLWDADVDGNQVGLMLTPTATVADGRFTVTLDFGADIFTGDARYLEIAVCCPAPCEDLTTLSPRQELTPAPYALFALTPAGPEGPEGPIGPPGPPGQDGADGTDCWDLDGNGSCDLEKEDTNEDDVCNAADCTVSSQQGCPFLSVDGVCVASLASDKDFLTAATDCAADDADICTDSQMAIVRARGLYADQENWTNSFADNDNMMWNSVNGGVGDNHADSSTFGSPCCHNVTPVSSNETNVGGIRVLHVHDVADTRFFSAAFVCASLGADLCDKGSYTVLREQGVIEGPVWASDHSDNDQPSFAKGVGSVSDNPSPTSNYGFACCATDRTDLACPGTLVSGVCMISVDNTGGTWSEAANDCAEQGARLCSISQTAVLRAEGEVTHSASWTASYSDNDAGQATIGVGSASDNHPPSSVYGWACCM